MMFCMCITVEKVFTFSSLIDTEKVMRKEWKMENSKPFNILLPVQLHFIANFASFLFRKFTLPVY